MLGITVNIGIFVLGASIFLASNSIYYVAQRTNNPIIMYKKIYLQGFLQGVLEAIKVSRL